jgi:hypothetical protein
MPALAACGDPLGPSEIERRVLRHRLEQAEAKWATEGPSSYVVTLRRICYCGEVEPRQVTVVDGVVTDVRLVGAAAPLPFEHWQWYPSVEALFVMLREAIDMPAHDIEAEYDPVRGYARDVWIDWSMNIADEEVGFVIESFVPT